MTSKYIFVPSAGSNVDISARVRAYRTALTANAEEGSVAISQLIVDDEESGINIIGHRTVFWQETSESSNTGTILHGFTADRDVSRGPFRVERARQWVVNVSDLNTLLGRLLMRGSDANRPAETDVARIQWLMSTGEMNLITDSTYISTTGAVAMDAADYRNQRVLDIIDDCAQQSGKNYFVLRNEFLSPPALGLFYDFNHSTAYGSAVRLTNVLADVDSTTTYAVWNDDLSLNRDPSRVYSSVLVPFDGGEAFVSDEAIRIAFARRHTIAPSVNVKSTAKATARGLRYLADIATEEDRLTMSYLVPLARVNRLREGQTFQVKFSHLPGYTDWTWVRALKRTTFAISEEFYKVTLEASPAAEATPAVVSCASQVGGMTLWDSGAQEFVFDPNPVPFTPAITVDEQSIAIGFWAGVNNDEPISGNGSTQSLSGFTMWGDGQAGNPFNYPELCLAGYKSVASGAVGTMTAQWSNSSGTGAASWRACATSFATSATSPVQVGSQLGGGETITLGATPTPGNLLVLCKFAITSGFAPPNPPSGFTIVGSALNFSHEIGFCQIEICVRCVQSGDDASYNVGNANQAHYAFLSEWAIT